MNAAEPPDDPPILMADTALVPAVAPPLAVLDGVRLMIAEIDAARGYAEASRARRPAPATPAPATDAASPPGPRPRARDPAGRPADGRGVPRRAASARQRSSGPAWAWRWARWLRAAWSHDLGAAVAAVAANPRFPGLGRKGNPPNSITRDNQDYRA